MVVAAIGAASIGQIFDGALLIVIFATSGALEDAATKRTEDSVKGLLDLAPDRATRIDAGERRIELRATSDETQRPEFGALLERMAAELRLRTGAPRTPYLHWIKASVGNAVRLIPIEQVLYLRADAKYTAVAWEGGEALIRTTIRELADALDPERFVQVHRSAIVNLAHVDRYSHGPGDSGEVHLKGRTETLSVR